MIIAKDSHGNYVKIEDIKQQDSFKGISPIDFKSNGDNLKNYRIYGNTVNGESVGDLITEGEHNGEYQVSVTIEGKNLLSQLPSSRENKGIIFTNENNYIHIEGTSTGGYAQTTDVTLSLSEGTYYASFVCSNEIDKSKIFGVIRHYDNSDITNVFSNGSKFTISEPETVRIIIGVIYANSTVNTNLYFQIEKNFIKTSYEPYHAPVTTNIYLPEQIKMVGDETEYIDFGEQKQHRVSKNLLENTATSQTINGLTFTVNTDGSVTCNGRREQTSTFFTIGSVTTSGEIILSGCPSGGSNTSFAMRAYSATVSNPRVYYDIGDSCILNTPDTYNIDIRIQSNYACDNLTFYPMIRKADIEDDTYEPYIENSEVDVTLPALPTLSGTNTLSVNTNIKPSKVWGGLNDPRDILYVKDKLGNILFSKYYEIEDEPPLTYKAKKVGTLKDYRIYGNTVDGESVGDRTANLFDEIYDKDGTLHYVPIDVGDGFFTLSTTTPNGGTSASSPAANIFFLAGNVSSGASTINNGVWRENSRTIEAVDGYVTIAYRAVELYGEQCYPWNNDTMLNEGSTALPYEPYGYKVPMIIKGINLFDESVVVDKEVNTEYSNYQVYHQGGILYLNGTTTSTQADIEIAKMSSINSEMLEYINQNYGKYVFTSISPGTIQIRFLNSNSEKYAYVLNSYTSTSSRSANRFIFRMQKDYQYDHEPIGILIKKEQIQSVYEPYHAPTTTTLYLPEQIKKVGDETEYIDFMEQKQHFADGTSADVTLPAMSTFSGTNILSVETGVQPSDIYLKGKIEKKPKIYYYSQDGQTLLYTESVLKGSNGMYSGTPTKMADPQYTYTFAGWSSSTSQTAATPEVRNNIQNDKNVYAAFSQTLNTYTVYFYNESDTPIETVQNVPYGGTATYTGATPTKQGYSFTGWSPLPTNITADTSCYAQFEEDDMYESITDTWSEIIANVSNGTYSTKYHIGDTKKIDLGTEGKVIMTIVGIDTDDLADNSGKAPITWISKQLLKTKHRMNPSYSSGTEGTGTLGGWEKTEMRSYLKETVKPLIPEIVRNAIKPVKKYSRIYNVSDSAVNDVLTTEDVWIPSYKEVFGSGLETLGPTYSTTFPDNASRIKRTAGSSATWWWLRSAGNNINFYNVLAAGSNSSYYAYSTGGVALGFCLGAPTYTVTYYSQDGQTVLSTETVEEGHDCTYSTVPTKESDTDFDHTFTGWSTSTNSTTATAGATENIQQNTNLYAAFSKSFKTDTISDSWEEIIANCDNGTYASKYQIGDLKTIDVGTEGPVQMQIVAIDTDLLASDNTKKAPITWISKQLLNTYKAMHGTSSNYLPDWANCDMRTYLRGTILPMLPSVVQNGIKEVTKYTCKRTSSTAWTTVSATENIWLPSYREISNNTSKCETSGVQYNSIFTDSASRVKSKVGDSAYYWWARSASGNSGIQFSYCFAGVGSGGVATYLGGSCDGTGGVAIGFCT